MKTTIIDLDQWHKLLAPINHEKPCGEFLKNDPLYDEIKSARAQDDGRMPQGIWQRTIKKADWPKVEQLCMDALGNKTKDLQIAAWLAEAWFIRYQIPGLVVGLDLIQTYCEVFWLQLYPALEEPNNDYRLAPFNWMNEKLSDRLVLTILTTNQSEQKPGLNYADWIDSQQWSPSKILLTSGQDADHIVHGGLDKFKNLQIRTPISFYQNLSALLSSCLEKTVKIEAIIVAKDAQQQGILNILKQQIQKIRDFCQLILTEHNANELLEEDSHIDPVIELKNEIAPMPQSANNKSFIIDNIASREDAYLMLKKAADVLARIEPHSPTPYLVRRAIAWGNMSLVELMQEIVNDRSNLNQVMQLLGVDEKLIPPPKPLIHK